MLSIMPDQAPHNHQEPVLNAAGLDALNPQAAPLMIAEFAAILRGKTDFTRLHELIQKSPVPLAAEALQTLVSGRSESDAHYKFFGALFKALLSAASTKQGEDRLQLLAAIEHAAKTCGYPSYQAQAALAQGHLLLSRGDLDGARNLFERAEQILREQSPPLPPDLASSRIPALNLLMGEAKERRDFCHYVRLTREAIALAQSTRFEELGVEDLDRLSALLKSVLETLKERDKPHEKVTNLAALLLGKVLAERLGRLSPDERAVFVSKMQSAKD